MRRAMITVALAVGLPALLACPFSFANEQHCTRQGGDSYCAGLDGAGNYCALDGCGAYDETDNVTGCVDAPPSDADCYRPCGEDGNDCSVATGSTSTSSGSTTTPSGSTTLAETSSSGTTEDPTGPTTGPSACEACKEARMICVDDVCYPCDSEEHDVSCLDEYPFLIDQDPLPYCENQACQACTYGGLAPLQKGANVPEFDLGCSPEAPACNLADGTCFVCESDDDCVSGACFGEILSEAASAYPTGHCMPPDLVFHVSAGRGSLSGDGSEDSPFANIAQAFALINTESPAGLVLVEAGEYPQPLALPEDHNVIVRGTGGARPVLQGANLTTALNGNLSLEDLVITGNAGAGIEAASGRLRLRGVEIVGNGGPGIGGERVIIDAANSILAGNGGPAIEVGNLDGALVYTTLANDPLDAATPVIRCTSAATHRVSIERCLYLGPASAAFDCGAETTAFGGVVIDDLSGVFVDADGLDFHVIAGAADLEPLGPSQDHFPTNDIDGDSRSAGDRVGADVP